jgi:hypothetical protein
MAQFSAPILSSLVQKHPVIQEGFEELGKLLPPALSTQGEGTPENPLETSSEVQKLHEGFMTPNLPAPQLSSVSPLENEPQGKNFLPIPTNLNLSNLSEGAITQGKDESWFPYPTPNPKKMEELKAIPLPEKDAFGYPKKQKEWDIQELRKTKADEIYDEMTGASKGFLASVVQGVSGPAGHPRAFYEALSSGDPALIEAAQKEPISAFLDQFLSTAVGWDVAKGIGKAVLKGPLKVVKTVSAPMMDTLSSMAAGPLEQLTKGMEKAGDYAWENIVMGSYSPVRHLIKDKWIPTFEALRGSEEAEKLVKTYFKSPQEIFQPAIERLGKTQIATFRRTQAMKAATTQLGMDIGKEMQPLGPVGRYEVLSGLRGYNPSEFTSPEARDIVLRYKGKLKEAGLLNPYAQEYRTQVSKLLTKPLRSPEELFTTPETTAWLKTIEENLHGDLGRFKPREVQHAIGQAIGDQSISEPMRILARDLYDLPATTAEAVAEASKSASRQYLKVKLERTPGLVRSADKAGGDYVESTWSPFKGKGLYLPRDVELELRTLEDIPKLAHSVLNKWFMGPWKTAKVILRPATHIRNTISNVILNDWGGLPFYRMDIYADALQQLRKGGKDWKEYSHLTGSGGTFSVDDVLRLEEGLKYGANMFDAGLAWFDKVAAPARSIYNAEEQMAKLAKFIWNKGKGMASQEAAYDAMKWTFNYGEVTRATAVIRGNVAPFFTWQSKVLPLMAETAVRHPIRFFKWLGFYEAMQNGALQQVGLSEEEFKHLEKVFPDYVKKGQFLLMPYRDDKGQLNMLNLTYMIPGWGDLSQWQEDPVKTLVGNPLVTTASTLLSKRKYSGAPLYYDWEAPETKAAKTFSYVWQQMMPAWAPGLEPLGADQPIQGGPDWNLIWRKVQDDPNVPSWAGVMASELGFKISPLNIPEATRKAAALQRIHKSEMDVELRRQLRRARSPEETQRIMSRYSNIIKDYFSSEEE